MDIVKEIHEDMDLPEDLRSDLEDVLALSFGNKPKSFSEKIAGTTYSKVIDEISGNKIREKQTENKIYAIDISTEEGSARYSSIVDQGKDPESDITISSFSGPTIMVDTSSPTGFRAIVIITTCIIKKYEEKGSKKVSTIKGRKS